MPLTGAALFRHIAFCALGAGLAAGVVTAVAEALFTVPLIVQAETYEQSNAVIPAHEHGASEWLPAGKLERVFYTAVTTVLTGIGYAFLLGACLSQLALAGWRAGLALGAAGFLVFQLAPAAGLPPSLPGAPEADLAARQLWWMGTAFATACALYAWWRARRGSAAAWIALGVALFLLPHIIGAPQTRTDANPVPEELTRQFAVAALSSAALFWLVLGAVAGGLYARGVGRSRTSL